eukprot:2357-Prymnesium_polylepis.1
MKRVSQQGQKGVRRPGARRSRRVRRACDAGASLCVTSRACLICLATCLRRCAQRPVRGTATLRTSTGRCPYRSTCPASTFSIIVTRAGPSRSSGPCPRASRTARSTANGHAASRQRATAGDARRADAHRLGHLSG